MAIKSRAEITLAGVTDLEGIDIGGRNLLQNSFIADAWRGESTKELAKQQGWAEVIISHDDFVRLFEAGIEYTFSFDWEIIDVQSGKTDFDIHLGFLIYSPNNSADLPNTTLYVSGKQEVGDAGHFEKTFSLKSITDDARILVYTNCYTDGSLDTVKFTNIKVEKGNTATDWTPAPEDMATADSVTALETRVTTAESKITPDAIVNTVKESSQFQASGDYVTGTEAYSQLNQTVNSISGEVFNSDGSSKLEQTASSLTSKINGKQDKGDYVTGTSEYSQLKQTVSGLSSTVQSHDGEISTLQQTAAGLQVRLENQQTVSNLVNKSRRLDGWGNVLSAGVTLSKNVSTSAPEFGEVTVAQFNASTSNASAQSSYIYMTNAARVTAGEEYTFSMWARKVSGGNARPIFSLSSTNQTFVLEENLTTEWKRYSGTFTFVPSLVSDKWSNITVSFGVSVLAGQTGVFEICCPQLEAGEKMNPWSANSVDATDYMSFTEDGLIIGDMTEDGLGNNVLIDSDSLDLRSGTDVAASVSVEPLKISPYTASEPITSQNAGFLSAKNIGIRADRYGSAALFIKETDIDEETGEVSTVPRAHALLYEKLIDNVAQTVFEVYADYFNVMSQLWVQSGIYTEGEVGAGSITLLGPLDATSSSNEVASLTFKSGYQSYGTNYPNKVWRFGNVCFMQGAAKPTSDKSASSSAVIFATIPKRFSPKNTVYYVCQGSGVNRWTLTVESNGDVGWSRYGTTSSSKVPSGSWLVFCATWMIV